MNSLAKLIIAEKPSVAGHIAKALKCSTKQKGFFMGTDYVVTWAYGHLVGLAEATDYNAAYGKWDLAHYPILPNPFKYKVLKGQSHSKYKGNTPKQQLDLIEQLANQPTVTDIIIATDWDREGQVIGDSILNNIKYPSKPVHRLLLNEWTENEIQKGVQNLIPNSQMSQLSDAGFCRQQMDWLIGINFTAAMTLTQGQGHLMNIGRVILPTLKIVYDRAIEQDQFIEQKYHEVHIKLQGIDEPVIFKQNDTTRFDAKQEANKIAKLLKQVGALTINEIETGTEEEYPKLLFNLTGLQAHITSKFPGWTSDKVLSVCQSLYEKQLITYPRTESSYLDESTIGKTKAVFNNLTKGITDPILREQLAFKGGKSIFNNSKVRSHGAIVPTYKYSSDLTPDETLLYTEIMLRFLAKFMPNSIYNTQLLKGTVGNLSLEVKGRSQDTLGWKYLYNQQKVQQVLNPYQVGDVLPIEEVKVVDRVTEKPNDLTEADILRKMEYCGKDSQDPMVLSGYSIGTPATRADTLRKLKNINYVEQKGRFLKITNKGRYVIEHFPIKQLLDLDFTGKIEKELSLIEDGQSTRQSLDATIQKFVSDGVNLMKTIGNRNILGTCPVCGNYIVDGPTGYGCLGYVNGCKVILLKEQIRQSIHIEPTNNFIESLLLYGTISVQVGEGILPHTYTYEIQQDKGLIIKDITNPNIQSF